MNDAMVHLLTAIVAVAVGAIVWFFIHRVTEGPKEEGGQSQSLAGQIWRVERVGLVIVGVIFGIRELILLVSLINGSKLIEESHPTVSEMIFFIFGSGVMVCVAHYLEKRFRD